jgi:hypothetical protein
MAAKLPGLLPATDVVIRVAASGAVEIAAWYRADDGLRAQGACHRVPLTPDPAWMLPEIWNVLFDEVLRAQRLSSRSVVVALDAGPAGAAWWDWIVTVARIVAHELRVEVVKAAPS